MKLCRYVTSSAPQPRLGVVEGATVRDAFAWHEFSLASGPLNLDAIDAGGAVRPLSEVQLLAPVTPGMAVGVGLNYVEHAREVSVEVPAEPVLFVMTSNAVAGPDSTFRYPPWTQYLDYEGELAVVIGRTASRVKADEAMDYVFGFTCANDLSIRDYQMANNWAFGKSVDGSLPVGPFLVTVDEIDDPYDLQLITTVNGQIRQTSRTRMVREIPWLIEYVTRGITLQPGDVIATGTPGREALAKGDGRLRAGDLVVVEIEGIGSLATTIVSA